jgi:flagellar protein FliO/FliZ
VRTISLPLSSVTRWLLVVVGCAVLETAQPMKAAEADAAAPQVAPGAPPADEPAVAEPSAPRQTRTNDTLLIPGGNGSARPGLDASRSSGSSSWLVVLGVIAGGAAWFWWRRRVGSPMTRGDRARQIDIEESRPLGNRQYLVVAAVGDKKFLLGITPGSIQMLAPLEPKQEPAHESVA